MSSTLSIGQALSKLQAQVALHQKRTAFHAQQEEVHRERRKIRVVQEGRAHHEALYTGAMERPAAPYVRLLC